MNNFCNIVVYFHKIQNVFLHNESNQNLFLLSIYRQSLNKIPLYWDGDVGLHSNPCTV